MEDRIRIGISSCLLGERVRYDGGHKLDPFLTETLGRYVEYVPVCPEVECGLPVPREPMHLEGDPASPRLITSRTRRDLTALMTGWAKTRVAELEKESLCGFIFKSRSPSSGMARVKVYDEKGMPNSTGAGIFGRIFMEHFPLVPVEDEGRLRDPAIRENFIELIFTMNRWRGLLAGRRGRGELVGFHTRHKLLILSHSEKVYREMGGLVARAKDLPAAELYGRYQEMLVGALRLKATPSKNVNVLTHMMGYFKDRLTRDEKAELLENIGHYKKGDVPLIVPVTLINHYVRKHGEQYLKAQHYLSPHPLELRLRNHA